jgi:hypothetical protein
MNYHIEVEVLSRRVKFLTVIPALWKKEMSVNGGKSKRYGEQFRERCERPRGDEVERFT